MINSSDLSSHMRNVVKSINKVCHNDCFDSNRMTLDNSCAKICYEKYVKTANIVEKETLSIGTKTYSEIINKVYNPHFTVFEDEIIFPKGGRKIMLPFFLSRYNDGAIDYSAQGYNEFKSVYESR